MESHELQIVLNGLNNMEKRIVEQEKRSYKNSEKVGEIEYLKKAFEKFGIDLNELFDITRVNPQHTADKIAEKKVKSLAVNGAILLMIYAAWTGSTEAFSLLKILLVGI